MDALIQAPSYHAHVYFGPEQVASAEALQAAAEAALGGKAKVWPLRRVPVGPHHAPMFEIEFAHASREGVLSWVKAHHGDLPVLIHPETGDDLADHRDHAVWLGRNLGVDLTKL